MRDRVFWSAPNTPLLEQSRFAVPAGAFIVHFVTYVLTAIVLVRVAGRDVLGAQLIVETTGNKVKAYISWYWDGVLILDVSDPANPVELARFLDNSTNGGLPKDFWGIDKIPNDPFIYASDRNGGLYIFKEQGSGSGK